MESTSVRRVPEDLELIVAMKFASVSSGNAFALAPPRQLRPAARCRRLGAVGQATRWCAEPGRFWPASSRRRDVGHFITTFDSPDDG